MKFHEERIGDYSVNDLFFKLDLYKRVAIDWKDCKVEDVYASDDEVGRKYGPIGYNVLPAKEVGRIIDFISCSYNVYGKCPTCKKMQTLSVKESKCNTTPKDIMWSYGEGEWEEEGFVDLTESNSKKHINKLVSQNLYIHKELKCPMCNEIFNMSFRLSFDNDIFTIQKIGQFPSRRDFDENYTNRFSKQLKKIGILSEYQQALSVYEAGYSVAAYVYIRRSIEKLIMYIFYCKENSISIDKFKELHFDEKIKYLEPDLPDLLKNKTMYDISSAGIHLLSEEECNEDFPILRDSIELILIEQDKKMKEAELKKNIDSRLQKTQSKIKTRLK